MAVSACIAHLENFRNVTDLEMLSVCSQASSSVHILDSNQALQESTDFGNYPLCMGYFPLLTHCLIGSIQKQADSKKLPSSLTPIAGLCLPGACSAGVLESPIFRQYLSSSLRVGVKYVFHHNM